MNATGGLSGVGVLVTRPAHQADGLCRLIERQGGTAHRFPVLEIRPPRDPGPLQRVAACLDDYELAIFVSANAVERALGAILATRSWPTTTRIAVIGRSSARALAQYGLQADLCPSERFDSEALLELPEMQQLQGLHCVIFRGQGGREHLAENLRRRGAQVDYVETYRRVRPQADIAPLLAHWRAGDIDIVAVNSAESLQNLVAMLDEEGGRLLRGTPLLVVTERMSPLVEQLGFRQSAVLAANATDEAVLDALLGWQAGRSH